MRSHFVKVAATGLLGVMALGSCGSDTRALSKSEYITKADAICKDVDAKSKAPGDELFSEGPPDADKAARLLPKLSAPLHDGVAKLKKLEPPKADAAKIDAINSGLDANADRLDKIAASAKAGDKAAVGKGFNELFSSFGKVGEAQMAYGFKQCGKDDEAEDQPAKPTNLTAEQKAFIAQGDALCKPANDQVNPLFGNVFSGDPKLGAQSVEKIIPIFTKLTDDLEKLTPPPGDEAKIKEALAGERRGLALAAELKTLGEAGDEAGYKAKFKEVDAAFEPADAAFKAYGFEDCGN